MNRRHFLAASTAAALSAAALKPVGAQKRYRACVIGNSDEGGYGHSLHRMWGLRDDVEVVGLSDPNPEGRAKHAEESKAQRTYADYREMLEKEAPDLVAIGPRCTNRHAEYHLACCAVGAHGILEKPLSVDLAEADAMIAAADAKSLRWALAFNFRASPLVQHCRRLVMEEGLIGELLEIRCRGKEDHRAGAEDLIVMGVHCFDMMCDFLGPAQRCSAQLYDEGRPSTRDDLREATEPLGPIVGRRVHAMYGFANGVTGYFSSMANKDGNRGQWGVDLIGSKGVITMRMNAIPEVYWLADGSLAPGGKDAEWKTLPGAPKIAPGGSPVWHYQPIVDDLIASIEEKREPAVSFKDGRNATEMIQATFESHVTSTTVSLPLERREHPLKRWT